MTLDLTSLSLLGMAQTGVPFGQVELCRDFLKVSGQVRKPHPEHPKRPVTGFECQRNEPSGRRFWCQSNKTLSSQSLLIQTKKACISVAKDNNFVQ
jgi:hypothetical protein